VTGGLVSIVTPCFNDSAFLESNFASVRAQDYEPIEQIVVDDGSTDASVEVIRRHEAELAWWTRQENRGSSAAINAGMAHASGEFLGVLNSDDVLLPGAVGRMVAELDRDPELLLVYGDAAWIDGEGRQTGIRPAADWDLPAMAPEGRNPFAAPSALWRRRAWELAGGWNEDAYYWNDLEFFLRILVAGPSKRIPVTLSGMRGAGRGKSFGAPLRRAADCVRFADTFYGDPARLPQPLQPYARAARAAFYRRAAYDAGAGGRRWWARRLFARSLLMAPRMSRRTAHRMARLFVPSWMARATAD
jgi:glycosyltransferase involved in cell wall biosynthesis